MALLSDIDWVILLVAAAFLLLGKDGGQFLRTAGRWYARAGRLKQELIGELAKAADLPLPPPGASLSIRGSLLGLDPVPPSRTGIPPAVRAPPPAPPPSPQSPPPYPVSPWTGGVPVPTWSTTAAVAPFDWVVSR